MSRAERRARAKLERTIVRPRQHRNEQFRVKQETELERQLLAELPAEGRAYAQRFGTDALVEAFKIFERHAGITSPGTGVFCPRCQRYEVAVTHMVRVQDSRSVIVPGVGICVHCPVCATKLVLTEELPHGEE